jgi:23S rRNA pseudouridine2457 synthase
LDAQSEGLLLLSDEPSLNARLLNPSSAHEREYWAQVENLPSAEALAQIQHGLSLGNYRTLPCRAWKLDPQPDFPPRTPPIRVRKSIPDCWIALVLVEGKYHQVRKMTAAVGHPTLRLVRVRIGRMELGTLPAGQWRILEGADREAALSHPSQGKKTPRSRFS